MRELFTDAQSAIRTACELEGTPGRPLSSRLVREVSTNVEANDAAMRAGYIWRALKPLKGVPISILIARASPRQVACNCKRPCCSGSIPHPYWIESINILCAGILSAGLQAKRYEERRAILMKIFGERVSFEMIAEKLEMDARDVGRHARQIENWIGVRAKNGLESQAWAKAHELLVEAGMVEPISGLTKTPVLIILPAHGAELRQEHKQA